MYVARNFSPAIIWHFARKYILCATTVSVGAYVGYEWLDWKFLSIPFLPVATIGTAVAFYVGFKNNSSYERLWEARRIWGAITNVCRSWATQVLSIVGRPHTDKPPEQVRAMVQELIYRQIAWANALRWQLRRQPVPHRKGSSSRRSEEWVEQTVPHPDYDSEFHEHLATLLPSAEAKYLEGKGNVALHLLRNQADRITQLKRQGWIDDYEHRMHMELITECYTQQGAAERIKSFPFPRQYAIFSGIFVYIFLMLVPFGLIKEMGALGKSSSWLVIPFSILISWVFWTMELVGDASEDPFEGGIHDTPMSAICRNIEVDLRDMLGEEKLPERLRPVNNILL